MDTLRVGGKEVGEKKLGIKKNLRRRTVALAKQGSTP